MKNPHAVALSIIAAGLLSTGCGRGQSSDSFAPGVFSAGKYSWAFRAGTNPADMFPRCSAKPYHAPGKFTVLAALGTFDGRSFSGSGLSLWGTLVAPKGHNQLPIKAPNLGSRYTLYYGTYKLSHGSVGCFYLARINYKGVSFDGAAAGWPNLHNYGNASPSAEGPLAIEVKGISSKGGSGTVTLKNPDGKTIEMGTVSLKGSKIVK